MKVLQPLWNESGPGTNNCLAYSNYSYSGIGPKERTLSEDNPHLDDHAKQITDVPLVQTFYQEYAN